MEPTERKEQLRKKFEDFLKPAPAQFHSLHRSDVFDFFYSEIEARDKEIDALNDDIRGYRKRYIEALSKLQRLEEVIKQADGFVRQYEHGDMDQVELCIEHYKTLKQQSKT